MTKKHQLVCLLCFISIFGCLKTNAQLNNIQVRYISEKSTLQTFTKMELGVQLPNIIQVKVDNFLQKRAVSNTDKVNPFVEWELDVTAAFTHVSSGQTVLVPAFYYRDFNADTIQNKYIEKGTNESMRIRFAPPKDGEWTFAISLTVKNKKLYTTQLESFTVRTSPKKGYVKVHENHRNFVLGDSVFYPVGVNFPSPIKGVSNYHTSFVPGGPDVFSPKETHLVTKPKDWKRYLNDVKMYHEAGGDYIRILQSGWGSLIEFEEKGNYFNRLQYAWEQDRLLDYCEESGVYILFNLLQQEPFMKYGNYDLFDWDWSHYRSDYSYWKEDPFPAYCYAEEESKAPHEMFTDAEDMAYHQQRTRYYLARYGYSTQIYLFELLSEPWHLDQTYPYEEIYGADSKEGAIVRSAVVNYHTKMAQYIKEKLAFSPQLIGIDLFTAKFYDGKQFTDSSIYSPFIDVIGFNPYSSVPEKLVISKSGKNNEVSAGENSQYALIYRIQQLAKKPIIISEGGAGDGVDDFSNYAQQKADMVAFGFCGLAGFNSWIGWHDGHEVNWPAMIAAQNFWQSAPAQKTLGNENGEWVQGRQIEKALKSDQKKLKELQYYVAADGKTAVGYVKNRTFNFHTQRTKDSLSNDYLAKDQSLNTARNIRSSDGKKLMVEGLKKGKKIEISWYEFETGKLIKTEKLRSKRNLALVHPELTVSVTNQQPIIWFSIEVLE